jgi:amino acid transporter
VVLTFLDALKRILVGRPEITGRVRFVPLPRRVALPTLASNALSSVAYAPDEILLTLALAGLAAIHLAPWVGVAVMAVMAILILSYRLSIRAYPSGRGDYQIASENLSPRAGVVVGSALLVDLTLTVAVSVSAAAHYVSAALPALAGHERWVAGGGVALLVVLNLRGLGRGALARSLPTVLFVAGVGILLIVGGILALAGQLGEAPSATAPLAPAAGYPDGIEGMAGFILVLRAFSTGSAALTGIEAPISGVSTLAAPRAKNAGWVLAWIGVVAAVLTLGVLFLASATGVRLAAEPETQLAAAAEAADPTSSAQTPLLAQLAQAVFGGGVPVVLLCLVTIAVLLSAGMMSFLTFPKLAYYLATDGYLPRQLRTRGDRLGYSNGILLLGASAFVLVLATGAGLAALIQLYVVGVFVSFTLSQAGMVRHWGRLLRGTAGRSLRAAMHRKRALSFAGFALSALVLMVVLLTKFMHGAWFALAGIVVLAVGMLGIRRHYDEVDRELAIDESTSVSALPSRVHAIVLVSTLRKPLLRAVAFARATRPQALEAVMVDADPEKTARTVTAWDKLGLPVPLTVLASPYRDLAGPLLEHIRQSRADRPRDLVVVYIPEYVVGRWWEQLVHNQTGLRLRARLHFEPGVVVASVPWQLASTGHGLQHPASTPAPADPARPTT